MKPSFARVGGSAALVALFCSRAAVAQIPISVPPDAPADAAELPAPAVLPAPVTEEAAPATTPAGAAAAPPTAPVAPAATKPNPAAVVAKPAPKAEHRLIWRYPRFRWWEYVGAAAVTVGNVAVEAAYQSQPKEHWHEPVLFDSAVRKWLNTDSQSVHRTATDVGDYTWYAIQYYVLADGIVTPLVSDKLNADVAFQLTLLNWQAVGLTGLLARFTHITAGRTRPELQGCSNEEGSKNKCDFRGASFLSGHAAMVTASAALGCMNHYALPLYGGGLADDLVCPVLLTGAGTVGVMRMIADRHWATDVLAGWALGGIVGVGMPWLLHYSPAAVRSVMRPTPQTALIPWGNETSGGLQLMGEL